MDQLRLTPVNRMKDYELVNIVNQSINHSLMHVSSAVSTNIRKATEYYYGLPLGNEIPKKSQVVSRDLADAVDWIMPSLMRIFSGSDRVVEFVPTGAEDIEEADQATDYINYLYQVKNPGFKITYQFIKDILLNKNGILKVYYTREPVVETGYYSGLDEEAIELLLLDDNIDLLEKTQMPDGTYDIRVSHTKYEGKYVVEVVPPEEFIISANAKDVDTAEMTGHRRLVTYSEMAKAGYPKEVLDRLNWSATEGNSSYLSGNIYSARHSVDGASSILGLGTDSNKSLRKAYVTEAFVRVDYDGDGIAELRRVVVVDNTLLLNEDVCFTPFIGATANIISHKFYGLSLYDKLKDIQEIKTVLLRNILDNQYNLNNGRWEILDGQVNLDDLLNNASDGIVRAKVRDSIKPLPTPTLPTDTYNLLSYMDSVREDRSGVSKTSQGLNANVLHSNQASSAVNQVMTAAQQQVELFARVIAETGFKPLFEKLYSLVVKHQSADDIFRLRNKFIPVSPSSWKHNRNVTVVVGLGNGNKDQQLIHLQNMWNMTAQIVSNGGMGILTTYGNIYHLLSEIAKNSGYPDYQKYWLDPDSPEGQAGIKAFQEAQAKPSPEEIRAQAEAEKVKGDLQIEVAKLQAQTKLKERELDLREREIAVEERKIQVASEELEIKREKNQIDKYKAISDATLTSQLGRNVGVGDGKT